MRSLLLFTLAMLASATPWSCDGGEEPSPPQPAPPEQTQKETKTKDPTPPEVPPLAESKVRDLLTLWAQTQNAGDFEGYQALFAKRFEGVKRIGTRTASFNRDSWLKDRKAMFAGSFTVKANDVKVVTTPTSAVVQFEQVWTSARFQDRGPKRLVVVSETGSLKIAREEMLHSNLAGTKTPALPAPEEFAFVQESLLMLGEFKGLQGVIGHPTFVNRESAERALNAALLPKEHRRLIGQEYMLYGKNGKTCSATVESLVVSVQVQPHFGQYNHWEGRHGNPKATPEQIALDLWRLSEMGGRFLAGKLKTDSVCEDALFARAKTQPKRDLWKSRKATETESKALDTAIRSHTSYLQEQALFASERKTNNRWEDDERSRFRVFEDGKGTQFVSAFLSNGLGGCGAGFDGHLWLLLKRKGDSYVVVSGERDSHAPSNWPSFIRPLQAVQAIDLDDDGVPEFIGEHDLIRNSREGFRSVLHLSPSYFDCPC